MQSTAQKQRIAAYRRSRPNPESLSDSQTKPPEDYVGNSHPVPYVAGVIPGTVPGLGGVPLAGAATPGAGGVPRRETTPYRTSQYNTSLPTMSPGGSSRPVVPDVLASNDSRRFAQAFPPGTVGTPPAGAGLASQFAAPVYGSAAFTPGAASLSQGPPVAGGFSTAALPNDLRVYILQLETQNNELRAALAQRGNSATPSRTFGGLATGERSEDEKRMFLNDVLSQVETVIQAHKNKTAAEIQKYKLEAENATLALRNLRAAIQQDGMDLNMAPAMLSFSRKLNGAGHQGHLGGTGSEDRGAGSGSRASTMKLNLPPETNELLTTISEEYLTKLLSCKTSEEVPNVVRETTTTAFEAIIAYFTEQVVKSFESTEATIQSLQLEVQSLREELRTQQNYHENQKVQLVQQGELELQSLRDQVRAYQLAATNGDEVAAAVNERAMEEYTHMLVEARREANHLRQELEQERNQCAQVCLRLKTSLQKRNNEFESAVVTKAEEVVKQHQQRVAELEAQLSKKLEAAKTFSDRSVQAGESCVSLPSSENFVPNVMTAVKSGPIRANNPHTKEIFEQEVWRKTQELLQKFSSQPSPA